MKRHRDIDTVMLEIEQTLRLGYFIHYHASLDFVSDLKEVKRQIDAFARKGDVKRAVILYETFLSGCYEKADEIDDSGGILGDFFGEIFCSWINARQEAEYPAEETVKYILKWMKNDDYGFCYDIEGDVALALDEKGLQIFKEHFQKLFEKAFAPFESEEPIYIYDYPAEVYTNANILKKIYIARKDIKSYLAICGKIAISPKDCETIAQLQQDHGQYEKALTMVEQGIELQSQRDWHNQDGHSLSYMKQELLDKLGRTEEAFAMAWDVFKNAPSNFEYDEIMKYVPKDERKQWHLKAISIAKARSLSAFIELCTKTKEWDILAEHILIVGNEEIEDISHYTTENAADGLSIKHSLAAAKIYRALGLQILNSKKSKYYPHALRHFQKARALYKKVCQEQHWLSLVEIILQNHSRKYGFLSDFEKIAVGESPQRPLSFTERTRRRWKKQINESVK